MLNFYIILVILLLLVIAYQITKGNRLITSLKNKTKGKSRKAIGI